MANLHLDFETFSEADLRKVGQYKYAEDPTTEILMCAVALDDEEPKLWVHPDHESLIAYTDPEVMDLLALMEDPEVLVYAHNAPFEIAISNQLMARQMGVEPPTMEQWRCTMAMARRATMPEALDRLAVALGLPELKDKEGKALIRRFCGMHKRTKKGVQYLHRVLPNDEPERFFQFAEYCLQDVRTEREVHKKLRAFELSGENLETFLFDLRMNNHGFPVNLDALHKAELVIDSVEQTIGAEFREITDGLNPTQTAKCLEFLQDRGYPFGNLQADTMEAALETAGHWDTSEDGSGGRALELRAALSYAAVKKIRSMQACACEDGYVRGGFKYYGADRTGRWSATKVQPHNFKRPEPHLYSCTHDIYRDIKEGMDARGLGLLYGNPYEALSSTIRHFIDYPGGPMLNADYSSIEARIVCWLAGQEDALEDFAAGVDQYIKMAAVVFNMEESEVTDFERFIGKQCVLGCGYQMGAEKYIGTCAGFGVEVEEDLADRAVQAYRKKFYKVAALWRTFEKAARNAIIHPGKSYAAGPKCFFTVMKSQGIPYLVLRLPSGRNLVYPHPRIEKGGKFGDQITFWGKAPKGVKYVRCGTYGAKLLENATQGTAACVMSHGARKAEERGYQVMALIHDEALGLPIKRDWWSDDMDQDTATEALGEFVDALQDLPDWATGLPVVAEGRIIPYYLK
jgi:DNA polymerase